MPMQLFSGIDYLRIEIASAFGLDKLDWDQRIAWTLANETSLESETLVTQAADNGGDPARFVAATMAYRKAQAGQPSGYPVSLDASASGMQILSVLTGCAKSASLCNVVSTGHREDAYTRVYEALCERMGDDPDRNRIDRKHTKRAVMTSLYSSKAVPREVFGEGPMLEGFYQTMEEEAPGAWSLNQGLQGLWQAYALSHDWQLPDGYECHVRVMSPAFHTVQFMDRPYEVAIKENRGTKEGRSISPNLVHSIDGMIVREMHRRCDFDPALILDLWSLIQDPRPTWLPVTKAQIERLELIQKLKTLWEESGFLSARILEVLAQAGAEGLCVLGKAGLEAVSKLLISLPERPFRMLSVHDCFRCLPNHANDMRRTYNQILSEIASSNLLSFLASQIVGAPVPVTKIADLSSQVLEAEYAIC